MNGATQFCPECAELDKAKQRIVDLTAQSNELLKERDDARIEVARMHGMRTDFDCSYAGKWGETSGASNCPADRPCYRCRAEDAERTLDELLTTEQPRAGGKDAAPEPLKPAPAVGDGKAGSIPAPGAISNDTVRLWRDFFTLPDGELYTLPRVKPVQALVVRECFDELLRLREQVHYANGTADLAMKHRDEAERERDDMRWIQREQLTKDRKALLPVLTAAQHLVKVVELNAGLWGEPPAPCSRVSRERLTALIEALAQADKP